MRAADVVVPVYRDVELTRACLTSVLEHSGDCLGRLIVVDDCSPEPGMGSMLEALYGLNPRIVYLRNPANFGFVRSANRGLLIRERDVVLLNSDTRVTPGWLDELLGAADEPHIAAAVPLSNNGALTSVPKFCEEVAAEDIAGAALEVIRTLPRVTEMPTGVGFCLLMKDEVIRSIGALDPAYGRGYHEENDWCVRARQHGYSIVRANRAFVYHQGSVSFGNSRRVLEHRNARRLRERFPRFLADTNAFARGPGARVAANALRSRMTTIEARVVSPSDPAFSEKVATSLSLEAGISASSASGERQVLHYLDLPRTSAELQELLSHTGPTVVHCSDVDSLREATDREDFEAWSKRRALAFAAVGAADRITVGSQAAKQTLQRLFPSIDEGIVSVVYDAMSQHTLAVREVRDAAGDCVFAFVDRERVDDCLPIVLEAFALFLSKASGRLLVLKEPETSGHVHLNATWPPHTEIVTQGPTPEKRALLGRSTALLFPSTATSSYRPVLDAVATRLPIIAPTGSVGAEIAAEGCLVATGRSAEALAAAMLRIAHDPAVRHNLSDALDSRTVALSWSRWCEQTVALYRDSLEHPLANRIAYREELCRLVGTLRDE